MTPPWATHTAINPDGTLYAFSGEPSLQDVAGEPGKVWEPISDEDIYQFIEQRQPDLFWRESVVKL